METKIIPSPTFSFGKYKGQEISDIVEKDITYIHWLYDSEWLESKYPTEYSFLKENWDFWTDIYFDSRSMEHPCDYN
jgi:hypothetical protein